MIFGCAQHRVRAGLAAVAVLFALLSAGCSSVVQGQGSAAPTAAGSSSPDFPSSTEAPPSTPAPPSAAPSTGTTSAPTPSLTGRVDALTTLVPGDDTSQVVRVPGGYEAATWDQLGHIRFWFDPYASTSWRRVGSSTYPYSPQVGPPAARVEGTRLRRMVHATFIVSGSFTGDSSGNAVAFTTGSRGWGAIKAEANGNIAPSGRPVGSDKIGLSYGFAFADGYLVTADCPQNLPQAECDTHQIRKRWLWAGSDFHRV